MKNLFRALGISVAISLITSGFYGCENKPVSKRKPIIKMREWCDSLENMPRSMYLNNNTECIGIYLKDIRDALNAR